MPLLAGIATAAVGIVNVVSALTPAAHGRVELLLTVASRAELATARGIALPLGVALLVAGVQLGRGRRGAAHVAVLVLGVLGLADLAKGLDVEEAALTWVVALGLWSRRTAFPVLAPSRVAAEAVTLAGLALAALAVAAVVPTVAWAAAASVAGAAALWAAAARGLVRRVPPVSDVDRPGVAAMVRRHGDDTLSAFKLRRDLQHRLYAGGRALVGQRTRAGALLVAGDPVAAPDDVRAALAGAWSEARTHGLAFGVVGASEGCAQAAHDLGLRRLYLGDEAMVATGPMDLTGGRHKSLRKAVNRIARTYTAELHAVGELDRATLAELSRVSERWCAGAPERGFSMANDRIADELLPDSLVVLARAQDGSVGGFLLFVPVFGRPLVSLGSMRRDRDTPNGLTDFLVVRSAELLADHGIAEFSLNFAAFGRWLRAPANVLERALAALLRIGDRWFQVERLERYNAKFSPRWQPRYLVFDGAARLPRIALAALVVEGQIAAPAPVRLRLRAGAA